MNSKRYLCLIISILFIQFCFSQKDILNRELKIKLIYNNNSTWNTFTDIPKTKNNDTIFMKCVYANKDTSFKVIEIECWRQLIVGAYLVSHTIRLSSLDTINPKNNLFTVTIDSIFINPTMTRYNGENSLLLLGFNWIVLENGDTIKFPKVYGRPSIFDIITKEEAFSDALNLNFFNNFIKPLKIKNYKNMYEYKDKLKDNYPGAIYLFKTQ